MLIKLFLERSNEFVVEGEDGYFVEANASEAMSAILPALSPPEKLKFEQMKDIYVAKSSSGAVHEGCYYFLVSRDAQAIKFESAAFMTSDLSARGGKVKVIPDVPISRIEDLIAFDPSAY